MQEIGKEVRRTLQIIPAQVRIREDWYDAVRRAATLCLPHILHGDTVDRGCSYL